MSSNPTLESTDLEKGLLTTVVEDVPPPAHYTVDVKTTVPQPTPSPGSRAKTFFLTTLYTVAFAITTLAFCLRGSLTIGFPHDERQERIARVTYASILGSVILGPICFTNQRFMVSMSARNEAVNIQMANGRLLKALEHFIQLCAVITGLVVPAATLGYGLIFWPIVYSDSLSTKEMVVNAVCIPLACLLGGLRWTWEAVGMTMWVLIRIPKISTGLEGDKYDRLMKICIAFTVFRWFTEGFRSTLPLCVLLLTPSLMDKCVAYYDKYREPVAEAVGPQPEPPASV